jgi:serine/threonine protein kinase
LGRYELLRPLAHGGMADVYLARRVVPDRPSGGAGHPASAPTVALKVLHAARAADPEVCAMFLDEARVVALLDHRNIAALHEVDSADGHHYLAMEYICGADLRELLGAAQRAGRLVPFDAALSIVSAAAAGLDHAHRSTGPDGRPLALVHRDVSLSNIMVGYDGAVKLVDFGIATTAIASIDTMPGVVRGKASYMSPEQCMGEAVDRRSDVFALGIVLYELTTGARCFPGKTDFERMLAVVRGDYLAPSDLVARFPAALEQIIRTALAPAPENRFGSAAAMREALARVAADHGWSGGAGSVQRLMHELRAELTAPRPSHGDDGPVTERHSLAACDAAPWIAEPTRPARRRARGTDADRRVTDADDDARTRGRDRVRRRVRSQLVRAARQAAISIAPVKNCA